MASPTSAITGNYNEYLAKGVLHTAWSITVSGAGQAMDAGYMSDKTVALTFGGTGTSSVDIEGSNATTATGVYVGLTSATQGQLTSLTANGNFAILQNPRWIRPKAVTVTASNTITINMISAGTLR